MRFFLEGGGRNVFYLLVGLSMVLVTTPSLSGALPASGAVFLWPLIGLLAYFLHLFEDAGKLASIPQRRRPAEATFGVPQQDMPGRMRPCPPSATERP